MKKHMNSLFGKGLALLLALVMVVGLLPAGVISAFAAAPEGLTISGGKTFADDRDQLSMEEELPAVPLTFEATVMIPAGTTARQGVIVGNWRNGPNGGEFDSTREYVDFEIYSNGHPRLYWQESHGKSTTASHKMDMVFDQVNVATGEYVHVAVTYDPDTDTACCYVDGVLKQTLTNGNITPTVPFGPMMVGGDYRNEASTMAKDCKGTSVPHNEHYFKGTLANLSVWSSVLSETEVKAHYDALCADGTAVPAFGTGLMGSWDFTSPDANGDYADKSSCGNDVCVLTEWYDGTFAEGDYTMLVLPDPQILMKWQTESWYKYTQWIADNVDDLNVKAVISVGDMINDNNATQWTQSVKGVKTFEDTGVPWIPMRGNHDPSAEFNTYYPYSNYSQKPWFGGSYEEGKMDFVYWFVNVGDREYMMLYLGWAPTWDVLDWAEEVIQSFPEKNIILSTHAYMNWDGELLEAGDGGYVGGYSGFSGYPEGVDIWNRLGKYENVVLALGGHIGATDLTCWEDENGAGKTVTSMLVDSQHLDYVAAGLVAVLTFHEDSDTVDVNWYSPVKDKFFRERNQFSITVPHVEGDGSAVDTGKLKTEILNAETLEQINYTSESWTIFASALADAKAVLADPAATQAQVDAAVTALKNAKAALEERPGLYFSASAKNYAEFSACAPIPETVELWVKIPKSRTSRNLIAGGYGYKSATSTTEIFWALEMQADQTLRWWEEAAGKEMKNAKFDGTNSDKKITLNTGEWMLISIVRDQEKKEVRAYINGELAGTTKNILINGTSGANVFSYTAGKTTTDPTRLGRDWREFANQAALTFEGQIGEIRTWSDDRTAAEIKAGFENGIDLTDPNLYGCWKLTQIPADSCHPHTFANLATGAAALTDLSITTLGFTSPRDTSALEDLIAEAKALTGSEYTAASWAALETALAAAEAAVADTSNTQADIVAALNALRAALDGLEIAREGLTFSASSKNYAQFSQAMAIPESVEVWFRIPEGYTGRGLLFGGYGMSGKSSTEIFWGIDFYSGQKLYWWEEASGRELYREITGVTANTGEWMLLSVVRDRTANEIRFYLNGEYVSTVTDLAPKNYSSANTFDYTWGKTTSVPIRLGRDWREDQGKATLTFEGQIGEIRVYSDGRTAAEIKAGYENDVKGLSQRDDSYLSDANLTGCWRLRDPQGLEYHPHTFENLSTGTGAVSALTIISKGFTSTPVDSDKTALKTAIDTAKGLKQTDYLDGWEDLLKALEEAEAVYDSPVADQTAVDAAAAVLNAAIDALIPNDRPGLTFSAASKNYAQFSDKMVMPETIEVWVKIPKDYTARNMIVGGYGSSAYASNKERYWSIEMNAGGTLRYWEEGIGQLELGKIKFDGTSANDTELIMINTGEWILITIVRDQENAQVRAYINGELAGTSSKVTASSKNVLVENQGQLTSTPLRLGRDWRDTNGQAALMYEGQIGELRVWNRDLTAAEIKANYDNDMKAPSKRSSAYLADEALTGCWQLRDLTDEERHAFTFENMATGSNAADLSIKTVGFTTVLDTSALEAAILEAQSLNGDEYTDESWAAVAEALEAALDTLNSQTAGQSLIDAAAKALNDALDALVDASVFVSGLSFSAADKNYAQFTACTVIPESVDVWVKIPKGYTGREMIVGGYGMTGKGYSEIFWSIEMNANGTLRWWEEGFTKVNGENSPREMASASFSNIKLNTGEWILISIVRDQDKGEIRAYINGELAGTTTAIKSKVGSESVFPYTTGKMTTDPPRLGRDWRETLGGSNVPLTYEGKIGELRIWTDDRTAEEIRACYQNDIRKDSEQTDTYLSDANLYGAWRLAELPSYEIHPYTYPNLATGTAAAKDLGIRTVGFLTEEDNQVPDYSAQYTNATGITFPNELNQMRAEKQFDTPIRTVSALINVPAGSKGGVILGNDRWAGAYSAGDWYINFEINSSGQPVLQLRNGNQSTATVYAAASIDVRGKGWVLVTTVFDNDCGLVRWYINGKRVETMQGISTTNKAPYQPVKIGGDYSYKLNSSTNLSQYNTKYFKGTIAYVSAWDTVRSGSEILAEAQALQADFTAVPASGKGLLASWSFNGTGDVLNTAYSDKSSNGNDAIPYAELIKDYDPQYLEDNNISTQLPEAEEGSYSVILLPDIQNITRDHMGGMSEYLDDYMQWIADNKEKYNIVSYLSMGDLCQDDAKNNSSGEWNTFANAQPILDAAGIPGVPMRGNHDASGFYAQFVDYDYYAQQSWFGGSFEEGYLDNCYWFFEAGGRTYLVFSLGWSTAGDAIATGNVYGRTEREIGDNPELIAWVNETIDKYPNANVILTAHNGMNSNGTYTANGKKLYDGILSKHDNVVLASYGHIEEYTVIPRTDERADGVKFPSLLVDGQGIDQYEGCHAFVCLLTFHEGSDEVMLNWYSVREQSLYRIEGQYSITIPHVKGVDLSGLLADMETAGSLNEDDYTAASWAALEEALAAAEEVVENKLSVSQDEVDAAEKALEDAIAALKEQPSEIAVSEPAVKGTYTYTGSEITAELEGFDSSYMTLTGHKATAAGDYEIIVELADGYVWADGSDGKVQWTIGKAQAVITVDTAPITVTYGNTVTLPEAESNFGTVTVNAPDMTNAGTYTVTYTVADSDNWNGATKTLSVTVEKKAVSEPAVKGTYTYTGTEQTVVLEGVESFMTIVSGNKATDAGNYEVVIELDANHIWVDGSDGKVQWTIGKAQAVITVDTTPITVVYGDELTLPEATSNFGTVTVSKPDMTNVGTYTVTYTVADSDNWTGTQKSVTVTVTQREIGLHWVAPVDLVYSGEAKTVYATATGLMDGDNCAVTVVLVGDNVNVGTFRYTATALSNDNYKLPAEVNSPDYTIAPKPVTVTAEDKTKTYGDADPALTYTVSGLVGEDQLTGAPVRIKGENAGTYAILQGSLAAGDNYVITFVHGQLTIRRKALTITAKNAAITYGEIPVNSGVTYEGFVNGEDESVLAGKLTCTYNYRQYDNAGTYAIIPGGLSSVNYAITYVNGSLTVGKKTAHITVIDKQLMISFAAPDLSRPVAGKDYTVTGLVNGDTVDVVIMTCNADMYKAGTYTIHVSAQDVNYTFTYTHGKLVVVAGSGGVGGGSVVCNCHRFRDVNVERWYHPAVCWAVNNGIMNGTGDGTTFSPMMYMNRAMMMTMLARLDGVNTQGGSTWYEKGMKWAVANGISDGTNPGDDITREQMVTMLYRYAGKPAVSGSYLAGYADSAAISSWAYDAMNWAVANGIIQGNGTGLNPQGVATRAEVAQILMNYMK